MQTSLTSRSPLIRVSSAEK